MCRFLVYWGKKAINPSKWILTEKNSLLNQSINDCSARPNPDGWGFAYRNGKKVELIKNTKPAYEDATFRPTVRKIVTDLLFAHVRRRSQGAISLENTHPFIYNNWMFMHNGNIPDFNLYKTKLAEKISDNSVLQMEGSTDSEFLFRLFIYWFEHLEDCDVYYALNLIQNIIQDVIYFSANKDDDMLALNFILTNGEFILGFRRNRSLHFALIPEGLLISSEKIDELSSWQEVPENHFIVASNTNKVKMIALKIHQNRMT